MTYRFSNRVTGCLLTAAVVLALAQGRSFASAPVGQSPKSASPNPNANQFNELSAVWWQWIFSFTGTSNPNYMNGAVDCQFGQSTHSRSAKIWFLAGTFAGSADRICATPIPRGISLFFPLLNT